MIRFLRPHIQRLFRGQFPGRSKDLRQITNALLLEVRPDENKAGGEFLSAFQRQKEKLRLVTHLLEGMQLIR